MKIKQKQLVLAIGLASSVLLASCGGGGEGGASAAPVTSAPVTSNQNVYNDIQGSSSIPNSTSSTRVSATASNESYASSSAQSKAAAAKLNSTTTDAALTLSVLNFIDKDAKVLKQTPAGSQATYLFTGLNRVLVGQQDASSTYKIKVPYSVQNTQEKSTTEVFNAPTWYTDTTNGDPAKFAGGGLVVAMIDGKINLDGTVVSNSYKSSESTSDSQPSLSSSSAGAEAKSSPFLNTPEEIVISEDETTKAIREQYEKENKDKDSQNTSAENNRIHGTKVAKILASKRLDGTNYGFAPNIKLKYAELKDVLNYKTLVETVVSKKPVVVNNSYHIIANQELVNNLEVVEGKLRVKNGTYFVSNGDSVSRVGTGSTDYDSTKVDVNYKSLYGIVNSLGTLTTKPDTPLFVFATGNISNVRYLLPQIDTSDPNKKSEEKASDSSDSETLSAVHNENRLAASESDQDPSKISKPAPTPEADLVRVYYQALQGANPDLAKIVRDDFGFKLSETSGLVQLLKDKDISDHLIVVTGASIISNYNDIRGASLKRARDILLSNANSESSTASSTALASGDSDTTTEKPVVSEAVKSKEFKGSEEDITKVGHAKLKSYLTAKSNLKDYYPQQYQKINISPMAIQCGEAKYSCLTAVNDYYEEIPYGTDKKIYVQSVGTSFAAPQVTAAAALVKEQFPWMTAKQLKTTLLTTAVDYGVEGVDEVYGWGMLNVAGAINGPAGFVFGDFEANLGSRNFSYFFSNSIFGNGGLIVKGGTKDYLYLLGDNRYTGRTLVESGNLVVAPGRSFGTNFVSTANLASTVYVNPQGNFYAKSATLTSVNNSGVTYLEGARLSGSLTNNKGATLVLNSDPQLSSTASSATLNGNLYIVHNSSRAATYGTQDSVVLQVDNAIAGHLDNVKSASTPLLATQVRIARHNGKNAVIVKLSPSSAKAASINLASTQLDGANLLLGASKIDELVAAGSLEYTNATAETPVDSTAGSNDLTSQANFTLLNELAKSQTELSGSTLVSTPDVNIVSLAASTTAEDPDTTVSTDNTAVRVVNSTNQELVKAYQALGETEFLAATYALSAPIFADIRAADSFQAQQSMRNFAGAVLDFVPQPDHKLWYYLDFSGNQTDFSSKDSVVAGKYRNREITIGSYFNYENFNFGVAFNQGTGKLSEKYQTLQIANAEAERVGLVLSGAYHYNDALALGLTLGAGKTDFKVQRNPLVTSPISSSFSQTQYSLDLQAKYRLWQQEASQLDLTSGVTFNYLPGFSFAETSQGELIKLLRQGYYTTAKLQTSVHLDLNYRYHFALAGAKVQLNAGFGVSKALKNPELTLIDRDNTTTASVFSPDLVAKLKAGLTVFLSDNVSVSLSGSYQKADHFTNKDANLRIQFTY